MKLREYAFGMTLAAAYVGLLVTGAVAKRHELDSLNCKRNQAAVSEMYVCDKNGDGVADTIRQYYFDPKAPSFVDHKADKKSVDWYVLQK